MPEARPLPIGDHDSIAECFARRVAATPAAVAYRDFDPQSGQWLETTWAQAGKLVDRIRAALRNEGLAVGDRVAIMCRNCREWVAFDQAAHAEGLVVVPLFAEDRPENVAYIVNDSGTRLVMVAGADQQARLKEVADKLTQLKRVVCVKPVEGAGDARVVSLADWMAKEAAPSPPVRVDGRALATIVYTSGTTGKPKGVMLSHQNMLQDVRSALEVYEVYEDDLFLSFLPLSHMLERTVGAYLTMVAGAQVAFARSIPQLAEDFKSVRPTVIVSVPRIFERLNTAVQGQLEGASPTKKRLFELAHETGWHLFEWKQGRGPWRPSFLLWPLLRTLVASKLLERFGGRLRLCISGGAALNPQIAHTFIGLGLPICQGYGLTEASPVVSVNLLEKNDPASIGLPLPRVEVSFGENQVLRVRGPIVMMGYWNNPEATAKVISPDGWLDTGDQARMKDGFLYITGRVKEIIVLANGEKVPPVDMEIAAQLDPLFEQVMIVGEGKPFLAALVVLNAEKLAKAGNPDDKALVARLAAQLKEFPGYAQVRRIAVSPEPWTVDNGLLTSTLKPRRAEIMKRYADRVEALYKGHK
jgi:long-chain acyl-CoA synthetase